MKGARDYTVPGLTTHDQIWFNAIREHRALVAGRDMVERDSTLDDLIMEGLGDKSPEAMDVALSQAYRYSAVLAGWAAYNHLTLSGEVCGLTAS